MMQYSCSSAAACSSSTRVRLPRASGLFRVHVLVTLPGGPDDAA